jgi:methylglyoxal synthase/pSer/pThr/pTyr-binding forkhead associated (FHA) protein
MRVKIYYSEVAPELEFTDFDLAATIKSKGECIIGRSPECDLVLDGLDLSRQHGKFLIKDEYYYFCDLGSRNGSLLNSELVERDREYLVNLGDIIRIGDFVLKMEQEEELAATVFKVIDPALFKSRSQQVENVAQIENIVPPILPIDDLADEAVSYPIIVDRSEEYPPIQIIEEQPVSKLIVDDVEEENGSDESGASLVIENKKDEEENPLDQILAVEPLSSLANDQVDEEDASSEIEEQPASGLIVDEIEKEDIPDKIESQPISILALDEINEIDISEQRIEQHLPLAALVTDEENPLDRVIDKYPSSALSNDNDVEEEDIPEQTEEHLAAALISDEEDRVIEEHPLSELVNDETEEDTPDKIEEEPVSLLVADEESPLNLVIEESPVPELVADKDEIAEDFSDELVVENLAEETDPQVGIATPVGAELLTQKQIVLIAHDDKIADLTDLVNQHKDFLAKCRTTSWSSVAESLRQQTGIIVSKEIPNGAAGGYQTIAGLVNSGDVLAVIFLRDFFGQQQAGQANEEAILRLCNINEILLATNIATAEAIVHYLQS